jgi:hypothetical protein
MLPSDTTSLSVCWYSHNRLIASATVTSPGGIRAIAHPHGTSPGPGGGPPPTDIPQPTAASCADLDRTEGIVLIAHTPGRSDSTSTAQLADCQGIQQWTTGSIAEPAGEPLASALREHTDLLIAFGYDVR